MGSFHTAAYFEGSNAAADDLRARPPRNPDLPPAAPQYSERRRKDGAIVGKSSLQPACISEGLSYERNQEILEA